SWLILTWESCVPAIHINHRHSRNGCMMQWRPSPSAAFDPGRCLLGATEQTPAPRRSLAPG
ncbi:hypothetical protein, partial [Paracoccus liaowanqingii]|uniref:hypothetical protein n=1 Tax=Paracoccus liaowanqingii TaxID=2560053 RepID=UPI00198161E1